MKPNKPDAQEKRSTLKTLHTLWVPMAVGAVLLVMLAIVANLVWKDYSTALMDSQTRQMELVVQSLADSIEFRWRSTSTAWTPRLPRWKQTRTISPRWPPQRYPA